jgi:tRNA A-37 threonylcarbamoyl transferase component Bud32
MHERGIAHCDVKPDNFCLPRGCDPHSPGPVDRVFIVDMGMACRFNHKGES